MISITHNQWIISEYCSVTNIIAMRLLILSLIFIAFSCTPPVVFEQAYPSGQQDLTSIPEIFQGSFICESDSALIIIKEHDITMHKTQYFDTPTKYIEEREDCKVVDDKMYVSGRLECIPVTMVNDTVIRGIVKETDTLFVIQEGSIARLYKGHLVINQKIKDKEWAISLLTPESGGDITFKAINNKTKIKNIAKVTHTKDITTKNDKHPRYVVNPTMTEFDALLADEKIFIECEYLTKVKVADNYLN